MLKGLCLFDSVAKIHFAMLLSCILLPIWLAPGWLEKVADLSQIAYVVDGARSVMLGDIISSEAAIGLTITIVLVGLGVLYGTRMFRRECA